MMTSGMVGDATSLMLFVDRPNRNLAFNAAFNTSTTPAHSSELKTIGYFVSGMGGSGLHTVVPAQHTIGGVPGDTPGKGLARLEGDQVVISPALQVASVQTLGMYTQILAPEVVSLQFRYFDGMMWQTYWDSSQQQSLGLLPLLPQAIEITLHLQPVAATTRHAATNAGVVAANDTYRMVVAIPVSRPATPNAASSTSSTSTTGTNTQ